MIKINLLPKELKSKVESEKVGISVVGVLIFMVIVSGLTIELLYATDKLLDKSLEMYQGQNRLYEQFLDSDKNKELEESLNVISGSVDTVRKVQSNQTRWSKLLTEFTDEVPDSMRLYKISADKNEKTMEVLGFSQTRNELILFKNKLEDSEYFSNVELPSSSLINSENIDFKMFMEIEDKALSNK